MELFKWLQFLFMFLLGGLVWWGICTWLGHRWQDYLGRREVDQLRREIELRELRARLEGTKDGERQEETRS